MMFDGTVNIGGMDIRVAEEHVEVAVALVAGIPVGEGNVMPLPIGVLRFGLGKKAAETHGQQLLDAADELPDLKPASDIVVAQNLSGVENIAQADAQFRKGQ